MGNELGRMIEQNVIPSVGEEEGMCFVVANLKKKVKAQHIKAVTAKVPNMTALTITSSGLKMIPPELANASTKCELKELNLANNAIKQLPKGLNTMFETLVALDLNKNALKIIEESVGLEKMTCLRRLSFDENKFAEVPEQIFHLTNLVSLHLARNAIERVLPDLEKLEVRFYIFPPRVLSLRSCSFPPNAKPLSASLTQPCVQKLSQLRLDGNRLTEFPVDALTKLLHLEILDLSNNQLSDMVLLALRHTGLESII